MSTSRLLMSAVYPTSLPQDIRPSRGETARSQPQMRRNRDSPSLESAFPTAPHQPGFTRAHRNARRSAPSPPVIVTTANSHIAIPMRRSRHALALIRVAVVPPLSSISAVAQTSCADVRKVARASRLSLMTSDETINRPVDIGFVNDLSRVNERRPRVGTGQYCPD